MAGEVRLTFDRDGRPVYVPVHLSRQLEALQPLDADEVVAGEFFDSMFGDEEENEMVLSSTETEMHLESAVVELGSRACDNSLGFSTEVNHSLKPSIVSSPVELSSRRETSWSGNCVPEDSVTSAAAYTAACNIEVVWGGASPWDASELEWWEVISWKLEEKVEHGSLLDPVPLSQHGPMQVEHGSLSVHAPVMIEYGSKLNVAPVMLGDGGARLPAGLVMVELGSLPAVVEFISHSGGYRDLPLRSGSDGWTDDGSLVAPRVERSSHGEPDYPLPRQAMRIVTAGRSPLAGWTAEHGSRGRVSRIGELSRCRGKPGRIRCVVACRLVRALDDCDQTKDVVSSSFEVVHGQCVGQSSHVIVKTEVHVSAQIVAEVGLLCGGSSPGDLVGLFHMSVGEAVDQVSAHLVKWPNLSIANADPVVELVGPDSGPFSGLVEGLALGANMYLVFDLVPYDFRVIVFAVDKMTTWPSVDFIGISLRAFGGGGFSAAAEEAPVMGLS